MISILTVTLLETGRRFNKKKQRKMIFGTLAIHFLIDRSHLTKPINPRGYLQVCLLLFPKI